MSDDEYYKDMVKELEDEVYDLKETNKDLENENYNLKTERDKFKDALEEIVYIAGKLV
jgi:FtsZ-binding cell division protein ZapB